MSSGWVKKYPGQRQVSPLFTAGQKYIWVGSGPISSVWWSWQKLRVESLWGLLLGHKHELLSVFLLNCWIFQTTIIFFMKKIKLKRQFDKPIFQPSKTSPSQSSFLFTSWTRKMLLMANVCSKFCWLKKRKIFWLLNLH